MNASSSSLPATAPPDGGGGSYEFGPRAWGAIYVLALWISTWLTRKVAARCASHQRSRLRDEYEDEFRRGGQMTNRLLLPGVGRR